ncbi:MAG: tRNA (cytidine(34)-2'-O)-methyltransferase [Chlamydiia bacterium]|nr:tRNA (cytidine(34)-2'-O)-methyltransferase [Chlamydiia bacterium]MCP5509337.1 tRNA (cytidine(34)-2'-O)-methyltransferase [Chlamydiales bacterium]HPE84617.1 tRNA (cytidine(34)-2'-O)-methyltransferase [Chlamydiales bacterium]
MRIILFEPKIPPNTGNIVRTCKVTGCNLVLINPGFETDNRMLKRAGLDYWDGVDVLVANELEPFLHDNFYFFSSKTTRLYTEVNYCADACLIFGSEVEGLPEKYHQEYPEKFVKIPMIDGVRCLNLATSVGIAVYEAWRQIGFTPTHQSLTASI